MANEAILRERVNAQAIDFIVADGAGIEKGTVCALADPRTAAATSTTGEVVAGIAAREKIASDGRIRLSLFPCGCGAIFDMVVADTATLGARLATSGANMIRDATEAEIAAGKSIGTALETGTAAEAIQVLMN